MSTTILIIIIALLILTLGGVIVFLFFGEELFGGNKTQSGQISSLMQTQRNARSTQRAANVTEADNLLKSAEQKRKVTGRLTLVKKIRYSKLSIKPWMYYTAMAVISVFAVTLVQFKFDWPIVVIAAISGPYLVSTTLNFFIQRRFNAFDKDYPAFLLNVVSMLKIGMNVTSALQSAAESLNHDSLVREEVFIMIDRLKLGVSEEKSIGVFGDDVMHPEIELFVQAVILSRRLGGNLSETLERLASQVRKRQHFRQSARAAVGLQRGSFWIILLIMVALEVYMYINNPELMVEAFKDPKGWLIWQIAIVGIFVGYAWMQKVTDIKV